MSPGAKLTVFMALSVGGFFGVRWLLSKCFGASRPSKEFKIEDGHNYEARHDADDSNGPHSRD